ncbi:MAG: hypothetical protein OXC19_08150 [Bryobacterales bacterium]|nr:hypothetical protein [Bryobacterales bacterium]
MEAAQDDDQIGVFGAPWNPGGFHPITNDAAASGFNWTAPDGQALTTDLCVPRTIGVVFEAVHLKLPCDSGQKHCSSQAVAHIGLSPSRRYAGAVKNQ